MGIGSTDVQTDLLSVPFPEMIRSMGLAIAEAQFELDLVSMRIMQLMSGKREVFDESGTKTVEEYKVEFGGKDYSLLELGFSATFYQFVDTIIEVKVSINVQSEESSSLKTKHFTLDAQGVKPFSKHKGINIAVSTVNASYANKYNYSAEGSSLLRTKLVTVPAPAVLEERVREMILADSQ